MVCLAPGPSRLPILPPPPLAPPLRHARIGILLCTLQLLPPSPLPFLLLILSFFFFYLSACLYFPPSMLNSVAQEPQDLTSSLFLLFFPQISSCWKKRTRGLMPGRSFLFVGFLKMFVSPTLFYMRTVWLLALVMGKRVRKMNFLSHSLEVVVVLSLIYCLRVCRLCTGKKKYCQLGCLLFWRHGVARVPVWFIFCPWLGILFQW